MPIACTLITGQTGPVPGMVSGPDPTEIHDAYFGVAWVEKAHRALVNGLLALVALHLGGVITASLRHRENLVLAMITGEKDADQPHGRL